MSEMIFREVNFFTASFLWGIFLLFVYDILRIIRRTIKHGKGMIAVEDLLFWIVGSIMVFQMIYQKNDGIIRGTAFLSIGLGMCLYHVTISAYVVKLGYGILGKPIKKICTFFYKALKKMQKAVKLLLETRDE